MSEASPETPQVDTDTEAPAQEQTEDIDWKAKAREWERRAKENKAAAAKLAEIEEANKTEAQKAAERLAALEQEAATARTEALRLRIAAKHGISDEHADLYLTGSDEDTLTRQAKGLAELLSERKKHGNRVPREGDNSRPHADERRAFADFLTGNRGS